MFSRQNHAPNTQIAFFRINAHIHLPSSVRWEGALRRFLHVNLRVTRRSTGSDTTSEAKGAWQLEVIHPDAIHRVNEELIEVRIASVWLAAV